MQRFILILLLSVWSSSLSAREIEEVFLQFNYQGGININLIAYYDADTQVFLLPISELFRQLYIPISLDANGTTARGTFLNDRQPYVVDFENQYATLSGKTTRILADQIYQGELDLYLSQSVFEEVFQLEFRVDFSNLMLRLVTPLKLPVVVRQERLRLRQRLEREKSATRGQYPIAFKREPRFFRGGFLDYAYQQNMSDRNSLTNSLSLITGVELLGGDVQVNSQVARSQSGTNADVTSWRYRYYHGDKPWLSQTFVGDVNASGSTLKSNMTGIRITNEPLYPDRVFDFYTISELTMPDSEVELFINDRLTDFTITDAQGRFTFQIPIVYGPNDIKVVIYGPGGELIESNRNIRIPFNFVPKGEFRYDAGYGLDENVFEGGDDQFGYARGGYGISRNLTIGATSEYLRTPSNATKNFTSATINASLIEGLFANTEFSPGNFLKSDVYYQTARGDFANAYYTAYAETADIATTGLLNQSGGAIFFNIPYEKVPISVRTSFDRSEFPAFTLSSSGLDLNARLGKVSTRGGFRRASRVLSTTGAELIQDRYQASATYTVSRDNSIWLPFRGMFLRAQYDAIRAIHNPDRFDVTLSRSFLRDGWIQFSVTHIVPTKVTAFFLTLSFDFRYVRTSANTRITTQGWSSNQSIRGAVAYEPSLNLLWFDNRGQVGRSAVIADLFIDNNDNGVKDEGEQSIPGNIFRFQGAGSRYQDVKGYAIYSQMLQYRQYDVEVNKAAVENPVLVPSIETFSIETDPNQHKILSIPFRTSGIFEGGVTRETATGNVQPLSGLRLYYTNLATNQRREVISFFDGSFYAMEVPPGDYRIQVDSTQLNILRANSHPEFIDFTIQSIPEGDFIAGLYFDLRPRPIPVPVVEEPPVALIIEKPQYFRVQTATMSTLARAIMAKIEIEEQTGVRHEIQYSRISDNYRVFSTEIEGLNNALLAINALRKTQFSDAFIIDEQIFATEDVFYAIQVGAFTDSLRAVQHINDIQVRYGLQGFILFDAIINHYKVILEPMSNFIKASVERDRLRTETSIKDAFLITQPAVNNRDIDFSVQFGMFDTQAQAYQLSQRLTNRVGVQNYVIQIGKKFYVRSRPTNRLEDAVILYRRVRTIGYSDAIIHTYRS